MSDATEANPSSRYDELNQKAVKYRNHLIIDFLIVFGGLAFSALDLYIIYPTVPAVSSFAYYLRTGVSIVGIVVMLVGLGLFVSHELDLSVDESLFMRAYEAAEKLNEYVASPSKRGARRSAKRRLRTLSNLVERNCGLKFKLAKQLLGPVDEFTKILRNKVLYSVEKGKHENAVAALSTLKRFEAFLLNDNPTLAQLSDINKTASGLIDRPSPKKGTLGRTVGWVKGQPALQPFVGILTVGAVVGFATYLLMHYAGADNNYATSGGVGVFVALPFFYAMYQSMGKKQG